MCNTVNSSGPAPQAKGLPVYQFLTGTIHAKLKQGIENLGTRPENCVGESALFIWEDVTDSAVNQSGLSGDRTRSEDVTAEYIL